MLKKLIDYIRHRRVCRANGYFCPDCIYHEHIFDGIVYRGKGEKMTRNEAKWVLELIRDRYSSVDVDRLSLTDAETDAIGMAIEAIGMAIEALENECMNVQCADMRGEE